MLCIALHRFFSSLISVSIWKYTGLQWRLTCIQTVFHTQTCIQVELSHTQACRELSPTAEEVSWILQLFLYTATQELIGYRQGKPIMTPKWYKKETLKSHKRTSSHTVFTILWDETTHSKSSFANQYISSNPRLLCLIWLSTVDEGLSPFPSLVKVALGTALVLTAVRELRDEEIELHEDFWGQGIERRINIDASKRVRQ